MSQRFGFLHIGKTAGSSIKALLAEVAATGRAPIEVYGHRRRLPAILNADQDLQMALIVRDPFQRFVSAFNARMRAGRPAYDYPWTPEEAIAFRWFSDANELGEALLGEDERLFSAAQFAMNAISHLRRNYAFHLKSVDYLRGKWHRIYSVGHVESLIDDIGDMLAPVGVPADEARRRLQKLNAARKEEDIDLTDRARAGIRKFWAQDFEIYEFLTGRREALRTDFAETTA